MQTLYSLVDYFDLRTSIPSGSSEARQPTRGIGRRAAGRQKRGAWWWNLIIYLLIVVGVLGKFVFDYWRQGRLVALQDSPVIIISCIIAALAFPTVYGNTKMSPDKPKDVLQYFLAFQNGFFWQTLIGGLIR